MNDVGLERSGKTSSFILEWNADGYSIPQKGIALQGCSVKPVIT